MKKRIISTLTAISFVLAIVASPLAMGTVYAGGGGSGGGGADGTAKDAACEGVALTGGNCDAGSGPGSSADKINKTIATVINLFSLIIGVTAVIMIMIGGFKYVTSSGDSASVSGAKNTIIYAIIGLVVVSLAQVIVRFVLIKV